jgi:hypothetical protein
MLAKDLFVPTGGTEVAVEIGGATKAVRTTRGGRRKCYGFFLVVVEMCHTQKYQLGLCWTGPV